MLTRKQKEHAEQIGQNLSEELGTEEYSLAVVIRQAVHQYQIESGALISSDEEDFKSIVRSSLAPVEIPAPQPYED